MNTIETLLESLNDYAIQSKQILQEGSDSIDRVLKLAISLSNSISFSVYKLSEHDKELINKCKKINITSDYRIATYSNIQNQRNYDIHAECNIDFVIESILNHISHPENDFDSKKINNEAIAKTFRKLTKSGSEYKEMTIDEFKWNYRKIAFGDKSVTIVPKPDSIAKLFESSSYFISYINNNLISKEIENLNDYYSKVEDKFNDIAKTNPNMSVSLSQYLTCLDSAIRNTLIMYKAIRNTFYELNTEYRYIFEEILSINKQLTKDNDLNESSNNYLKDVSSKISILSESILSGYHKNILDESILINNSDNSKLSDKSKSLLDELICLYEYDGMDSINEINELKNFIGIINRISNDDLSKIDRVYRINSNMLNRLDMSGFISKLNNKIDFCKNQFEKLINTEDTNSINSYSICKDIMNDLFFWDNSIPDNDILSIDFQNQLCSKCSNMIFGKSITIKINNLNSTFDNIVEIPNYLLSINNHLISFSKMIIDLIMKLKQNNNLKTELIITKLLGVYNLYYSIISCIYFNLLAFEKESIRLVQNLIDEINLK